MANSKKFYWLRLQANFFQSDDIKLILAQKDGADYVIFWQKLLLKSISAGEPGVLKYKENIPYTPEMLATVTDTSVSIVKAALNLFHQLGMIDVKDDGEIWIEEATKLIGSESESAERVRKFREKEKQKALQCNSNVTDCNTDVTNCNKNVTQSKSKSNNKSNNKSIELEKELEEEVRRVDIDLRDNKAIGDNKDPTAQSCKNTSELADGKNPTVVVIRLNGQQKEFPITQQMIYDWQRDFPLVDVAVELRKMRAWSEANPNKRKTIKGVKRFIVNWLSRQQDNSNRVGGAAVNSGYSKQNVRLVNNENALNKFLENIGESVHQQQEQKEAVL